MTEMASSRTIRQGGVAVADDTAACAPVVRACGLFLEIDDHVILQDICLEVPPGRSIALLGANGAGKTMLLRVLSTLIRPSGGALHLFGEALGPHSERLRSRIGVIAHQSMLYRDLSAQENLVFFGKLYDVPRPAERATEMLGLVGLSSRADDPVRTLSRGMAQRVAVARALLHDPDLLLADEPFDGLDAPSADALGRLLSRLHGEGKAIVLSNHYVPQTLELVDEVVVLRRGRIVFSQPSAGLTAEAILKEIAGP